MSKRQKYWLLQAIEVGVIMLLVWILPVLKWWQYLLLGAGVALYALLVEAERKL